MTRDKEELEAMVREQFPLIYSMQDPVEADAYASRRNALIDYATAVSAPWLSAEAIRYQTMLLASALLFLSFALLNVSSFKIADATVALDWKAFALYGLFLIGVGAIFAFKAWVDYDRAGFSRVKNVEVIGEIRHLILVGQLGERIEQHYRHQLDRAIADAYRTYNAKMMASLGQPPSALPDIQLSDLDIAAVRAIPELAGTIERQEAWLAKVVADLEADLKRLVDKADEALRIDQLAAEKAGGADWAPRNAPEAIRAAYGETLAPWLDMRSELATEGVKAVFERVERSFISGKLGELDDILGKIVRIRRWTFRLEVLLPLAFTAGVIGLVAWQVAFHGLPRPQPPAATTPARG